MPPFLNLALRQGLVSLLLTLKLNKPEVPERVLSVQPPALVDTEREGVRKKLQENENWLHDVSVVLSNSLLDVNQFAESFYFVKIKNKQTNKNKTKTTVFSVFC